MIIIFMVIALFITSNAWSTTPEIHAATYRPLNVECPHGRSCRASDNGLCSGENIEIFPNNDGSFDLVFTRFEVETGDGYDYGHVSCKLEIPIKVPPDKKISLEAVAITGLTIVPDGGRANASITYSTPGGRESARIETFVEPDTFLITHKQEIGDSYSYCGKGNAVVGTLIGLTVSKPLLQRENTLMSVSGGSGKLVYQLHYEDCQPVPEPCNNNQIEVNDTCYDISNRCSDYHATNKQVCNNGEDNLRCDWDVKRNLCYTQCKVNQFHNNGICYDKAKVCSDYDSTNTQVCNNGEDSLRCDWWDSKNKCVSTCPENTVEENGVCIDLDTGCSQYDGTNKRTCNNSLDNLSCDWIPENFNDKNLANTCVSECPSNSFEENGVCYARNGTCSQYNDTNKQICNNSLDNLTCDWVPHNFGDHHLENTCVSNCPGASFEVDGQCYKNNGACSQYNGTSSNLCNTSQDNMRCDWDERTKICYPE